MATARSWLACFCGPAPEGSSVSNCVLAARESFQDLAQKLPAVVCAVMEVDGALEELAKSGVRFSQVPCVLCVCVCVCVCLCVFVCVCVIYIHHELNPDWTQTKLTRAVQRYNYIYIYIYLSSHPSIYLSISASSYAHTHAYIHSGCR